MLLTGNEVCAWDSDPFEQLDDVRLHDGEIVIIHQIILLHTHVHDLDEGMLLASEMIPNFFLI